MIQMTPNMLGDTGLLLAGVTEEQPKAGKETVKVQNSTIIQRLITTVSPLEEPTTGDEYEWKIVWRNVLGMVYLHVGGLYGLYLIFTQAKSLTFIWGLVLGWFAAVGVTAGAHRLWAHRTYKAKWQLRLFLMVLQTICFQNHIYEWVRDHRVHHKYTDTNADPHNSKRGFFFSHVGWLLIKKHKDVKIKGCSVDLSDLRKDPIVMFQKRTYLVLMPLLCFVLPATVPWYFFGETWWNSWYVSSIFRYITSLHLTWLVNSAAHIYGYRPFDKTISPTENKTVSILAIGEGWHNYHHVFPWDYKAAELPGCGKNLTLGFLNQMAKIGWAYNMKTVAPAMVAARAARTGDGSHNPVLSDQIWGWGDVDMKEDDKKYCEVLYRRNE